MKIDLEAYHLAPSGEGDLADAWQDKPHRLVYDLVSYARALEKERDDLLRDLTGMDAAGWAQEAKNHAAFLLAENRGGGMIVCPDCGARSFVDGAADIDLSPRRCALCELRARVAALEKERDDLTRIRAYLDKVIHQPCRDDFPEWNDVGEDDQARLQAWGERCVQAGVDAGEEAVVEAEKERDAWRNKALDSQDREAATHARAVEAEKERDEYREAADVEARAADQRVAEARAAGVREGRAEGLEMAATFAEQRAAERRTTAKRMHADREYADSTLYNSYAAAETALAGEIRALAAGGAS